MESGIILGLMGLGGQEIFLVALFVLLFFGAKKIPELMRGLGQGINEFKNATKDVKENIEKSICGEIIEFVNSEEKCNEEPQRHVNYDDGNAVEKGFPNGSPTIIGTMNKEAYCHGDNGPYTGGEKGQQSSEETKDKNC